MTDGKQSLREGQSWAQYHIALPKAELGCNLKSYKLPNPKGCPPFLLNCTVLSVSPLNLNVLVAPNSDVFSYQGWGEI